jgi:hypothetical protein
MSIAVLQMFTMVLVLQLIKSQLYANYLIVTRAGKLLRDNHLMALVSI